MEITFDKTDSGIHKVIFDGDLDYHASGEIREKVGALLADKPEQVMINLEKVPYMDSSGIAAFVEMSRKSKDYGGKIVFYNITDSVRSIFELAKLNLFFTLSGTEEEAIQAFNS